MFRVYLPCRIGSFSRFHSWYRFESDLDLFAESLVHSMPWVKGMGGDPFFLVAGSLQCPAKFKWQFCIIGRISPKRGSFQANLTASLEPSAPNWSGSNFGAFFHPLGLDSGGFLGNCKSGLRFQRQISTQSIWTSFSHTSDSNGPRRVLLGVGILPTTAVLLLDSRVIHRDVGRKSEVVSFGHATHNTQDARDSVPTPATPCKGERAHHTLQTQNTHRPPHHGRRRRS